tara:strand:+ start:117 stop:767 length:651 start_codon:yes stop_codon:yes gene_type:complete
MFRHKYNSDLGIFLSENIVLENENSASNGVLFLDRDGVMIEEKHYLCDPQKVSLIYGLRNVLQIAKNNGMNVVVVTNQSGIARDLFDWEDYISVTERMLKLIGGKNELIDLIIACPMHEDGVKDEYRYDRKEMRKPKPGMIQYAMDRFKTKASQCKIVGDKVCDLEAGIEANIKDLFHVKTGHGLTHRAAIMKLNKQLSNVEINEINSIKDLANFL